MINHEHKYIFIHIPKTAGNSIKKTLMGNYELVHRNIEEYEDSSDYFKFSFVRNPYNRLYSWIYESEQYNEYWKNIYPTRVEFNSFVRNELYDFKTQYSYIKDKMNFVGRFENLQEDFDTICDMIGLKKGRLPHIMQSGHPDYYKDGYPMDKIFDKNKNYDYLRMYDNDVKELVYAKYEIDFLTFNYE